MTGGRNDSMSLAPPTTTIEPTGDRVAVAFLCGTAVLTSVAAVIVRRNACVIPVQGSLPTTNAAAGLSAGLSAKAWADSIGSGRAGTQGVTGQGAAVQPMSIARTPASWNPMASASPMTPPARRTVLPSSVTAPAPTDGSGA